MVCFCPRLDNGKTIKVVFFRYGRLEDESAGVIEEELYVIGRGKQTTVEMVGAKSVNIKQRFVRQGSIFVILDALGSISDILCSSSLFFIKWFFLQYLQVLTRITAIFDLIYILFLVKTVCLMISRKK